MERLTEEISLSRISRGQHSQQKDLVVKESPLTIFLNDEKELVTLLCTPKNIEYLAVGFLASEGLIDSPDEIASVEPRGQTIVSVKLKDKKVLERIMQTKRAITSGCGRASIFYEATKATGAHKVNGNLMISSQKVFFLVRQLEIESKLFKTTGGVHSAALSNGEDILIFNEDIGRHNAVDKVFGECFLKQIPLEDKLLLTSGRVSSEILLKVARRRLSIIISRSAPTDLAVEIAKELGITLIGFVRGLRMNIYSHPRRVN
jgi:FdhD protein